MLSRLKMALPALRSDQRSAGDATPTTPSRRSGPAVLFEQLESRILLSAGACPVVESIVADNRGRIVLTFSESINPASLIAGSFSIITAGADQRFGTDDDVSHEVKSEFLPGNENRVIRISAELPATVRYQVIVRDSLRNLDGERLDGEFNGVGVPTGDGVEGGDLIFFTRSAASQIARFTTVLGNIDVELFRSVTPISVANFLNYANSGRYDETIIHRNVSSPTPFVIQGGGFEADRPFSHIEVDAPIQNEPFRSNTRGTLAFAKLGGNPNSATSEWFFNLGDNSGNLDSQNGGFTVFGRIIDDAGLDVMDAISALTNINAQSLQSAFTDLPVLNDDPLPTTANLDRDDLVLIERIAVLLDISGEPAGMLDAPAFVFDSGLRAKVFIYDLTGSGMADPSSAISVQFDGNRVKSITLRNGAPLDGVGIVISGALGVGEIKDSRSLSSAGDIAFIIADARIGKINIRGSITGANVNGLVVGEIPLADDIDEDGDLNDLTAIYIPKGFVDSIVVVGSLSGDVIITGGVDSVQVNGQVSGSDFRIGAAEADPRAESMYRFNRVRDLTIDSAMPIEAVLAQDWIDNDLTPDRLRAPSVDRITIRGARGAGVAGDFHPTIVLTGVGVEEGDDVLRVLDVAGVVTNADFDVDGNVGVVNASGGLNNWRASVTGAIRAITAGPVSSVSINAGGAIDRVVVTEWLGGDLQADSIRLLTTKGARGQGIDGDFIADLNLRGVNTELFSLDRFIVAGAARNAFWSIGDSARSVVIKGDFTDVQANIEQHIVNFRAGAVINSGFDVEGGIGTMIVKSWDRGRIDALEIQSLRTTGAGRDNSGEFHANVVTNRLLNFRVKGDLRDSNILINQSNFDPRPALQTMFVGGAIRDSLIRARGVIGKIDTVGMHNSTIAAGANTDNEFFPTGGQINVRGVLQDLNIRRVRGQEISFSNSYVAASTIERLYISEINTDNFFIPFGVAAREINSMTYRIDGVNSTYRTRDGAAPGPFGDFQIRVNFVAPPVA